MATTRPRRVIRRMVSMLAAVVLLLAAVTTALPAHASDTPDPTSVTIAGSLQSELGCSGDWDPSCAMTHLAYDSGDGVWQGSFSLPAGSYEYKAALNDAWDENYGANAVLAGANISFSLAAPATVKFYYDHETHWVTDTVGSVIAVAPGSFQSELGCPGDWDPGCLRSWLEDPDGDGIYTFVTTALPAGVYEAKAALNETWDVNYGVGGAPDGPNISFSVPSADTEVWFSYGSTSHILTIVVGSAAPTVDAGGPYSVEEGGAVAVSATGSDPSGDALSFAWDMNDDGTFETLGQVATFSAASLDGPSSQAITVRATNPGGVSTESSSTVAIENVAPAVSASFVSPVVRCCTNNARLRVTFSDPGDADTHVASIDWGDGTTRSIDPATSPFLLPHTYAHAGPHTATVTVMDDDGGNTTRSATVSVWLATRGVQPPVNADGTSVFKYGTTIAVNVRFTDCDGTTPSDLAPTISVTLLSTTTPRAAINEAFSAAVPDATGVMRYSAGRYVYNVSTLGLPDRSATYRISITVPLTGQTVKARVGVKP